METEFWQSKIDAAAANGGGVVRVTEGDHLIGGIYLRSNVTLEIPEGARLVASTNSADYAGCGKKMRHQRAVVSAFAVTNVAIVGRGVIDGRGWSVVSGDGAPDRWKDAFFYRSKNIRVEGVTFRDPASWTCYFRECDGVVARGVKIRSLCNHNNDGFDIEAKNVLIEDCDIISEDDSICFKSDNPRFVTENCIVRRCRVSSVCNFIKFGTSSKGVFRNVLVEDCDLACRGSWDRVRWDGKVRGVTSGQTGISGIALEVVDGGVMENVTVRNITMGEGVQTPVFIRLGAREERAVPDRESRLRHILIENVKMTAPAASLIACSITGVPGLCPRGIVIRNCDFRFPGGATKADCNRRVNESITRYPENRMFGRGVVLPAYAFYLRHADDVRFENVKTSVDRPDARPEYFSDDCNRIKVADRPPYGETEEIQRRLDAAWEAGGGTVTVGAGLHPVSSLFLDDNVTLKLEKGAVLEGSTNFCDYISRSGVTANYHTHSIVSSRCGATNVALVGEGTIDGRGWAAECRDGAPRRWHDVHFYRNAGVRVEGVTLRDSATWTCYLKECENCVIRGVKIRSLFNWNNDGIDIDSKHVLVENCDIDSDDDAICPKSDNPAFICEDIEVRNCRLASNCNHIKLGTSSRGGFRNIRIHHCELVPCATNYISLIKNGMGKGNDIPGWDKSATGSRCGIAVECVDGGFCENIHIHDIKMNRSCQTPIFVRLGRRREHPEKRESYMRDVLIENITGESMSLLASSITGVPGLRPNGVTIRNVDLMLMGGGTAAELSRPVPENEKGYPENRMFGRRMLPAYGFYVRHADGVRFDNVKLRYTGNTEERPAVFADDAIADIADNCDFQPPVKR